MGFFSGFNLGHLMAPIGGLVSGLLSASSARQAARYNAARAAEDFERNRSLTMEMYELQRKNNIEFWNMQNAYNHPKMQMARLKEAGLNPLLVYGHGSVAGNTAGAIGNPSMSVPESHTSGMSGTRYDIDLGSIFQYSQIKNSDMNTKLQEAQIAKIAADIAYKQKVTSLLDRTPAALATGAKSSGSKNTRRLGFWESVGSLVPFIRGDKAGRWIDENTSPYFWDDLGKVLSSGDFYGSRLASNMTYY